MKKIIFKTAHPQGPREREGFLFEMHDHPLVVREEDGEWQVDDFASGFRIVSNQPTRESAIKAIKHFVGDAVNMDALRWRSQEQPTLNHKMGGENV